MENTRNIMLWTIKGHVQPTRCCIQCCRYHALGKRRYAKTVSKAQKKATIWPLLSTNQAYGAGGVSSGGVGASSSGASSSSSDAS